jgi:hypothetical protein
MSGSTQVSQTGRYYRVTLMTPSIHFAANPETGESGERAYHDAAHAEFDDHLQRMKPALERQAERARDELKLVPYDEALPARNEYELEPKGSSGPCRMAFWVGGMNVEVVLADAPSRQQHPVIEKRIRELFSMAAEGGP